MRKNINLMLGTDPLGRGGIASVASILIHSPLLTKFSFEYITTHRNGNKMGIFIIYIRALLKICWITIHGKPGVAHFHMSSRGSFLRKYLIFLLCKFLGYKTLIHLHSGEFDKFYFRHRSGIIGRFARKLFVEADHVVVLGHFWKKWMEENGFRKGSISIVYNPIDTDYRISISKDRSILFLGRLTNNKGLSDLLNAMKLVIPLYPNCQLVLGGDGEMAFFKDLTMKLGLSANVKFLGWVEGAEKTKLLSSSSIFVLPSYAEGFPVGIVEAMAHRMAIIATSVGGVTDAITSGTEGILISPGDVNGLAKELIRLLNSKIECEVFGEAAYNKFIDSFSSEKILKQWQQIYEDLLSDRRN